MEVYRYNEPLAFSVSTTALSNSITIIDMGMAEFVDISEIDVSMKGYANRASDAGEKEVAWGYIKSGAGL